MTAPDIIRQLHLLPHPEGGYYRETYRSDYRIQTESGQPRHLSTAIYYLLANDDKSHFHRIKSDELWFFHQGQTLEIIVLGGDQPTTIRLGGDLTKGEVPQAVVPANTWFAARLEQGTGFGLVSCTVAPGFEYVDFELARRAALLAEFPHLPELIRQFTRS
ncbi:cupin domain-containing protein [Hymenobacter algoricola]|uniref:Cupin domain-containing protein n=1 Tax=Hymenobacter algoricola TaxID=486267 RepID=A0ABP7NEL6_9BACT